VTARVAWQRLYQLAARTKLCGIRALAAVPWPTTCGQSWSSSFSHSKCHSKLRALKQQQQQQQKQKPNPTTESFSEVAKHRPARSMRDKPRAHRIEWLDRLKARALQLKIKATAETDSNEVGTKIHKAPQAPSLLLTSLVALLCKLPCLLVRGRSQQRTGASEHILLCGVQLLTPLVCSPVSHKIRLHCCAILSTMVVTTRLAQPRLC
jgi:hypothetical protein